MPDPNGEGASEDANKDNQEEIDGQESGERPDAVETGDAKKPD